MLTFALPYIFLEGLALKWTHKNSSWVLIGTSYLKILCHTCNTSCPAIHLLAKAHHCWLASSLWHFLTFRLQKQQPLGVIPCSGSELGSLNSTFFTCPLELHPAREHGPQWKPSTDGCRKTVAGPLTDRDCSKGVLNYTFHHQPVAPTLVATASAAGRQMSSLAARPDPQQLTWNNPANVHNKVTAHHRTAQHLPRNQNKTDLCDLVSAWGRSSAEGLGMAIPETQPWWLTKRIFFFFPFFFFLFWLASDLYSEFRKQTPLQTTVLREPPLLSVCTKIVLCCISYLEQHYWMGLE